jgi:hypothetical protein
MMHDEFASRQCIVLETTDTCGLHHAHTMIANRPNIHM